jgi:hypothetical protein
MPFVPVANSVLTEIRYTQNAQQVENTLWFEFPTAPAAADLVTLDNAVMSWWSANVQPLQSSAVQLREIHSTAQDGTSGVQDTFAPPVAAFGGASPNVEPGNVTMAISFRTGLRGRSFRGRNYAVGLTEDQVAGNDFVAGLTSLWQAAYAALIPAAAAAGWTWIIASRFSGVDVNGDPIPRAAGVTTPVTAVVVVDSNVDSQRRRLTGRGN